MASAAWLMAAAAKIIISGISVMAARHIGMWQQWRQRLAWHQRHQRWRGGIEISNEKRRKAASAAAAAKNNKTRTAA